MQRPRNAAVLSRRARGVERAEAILQKAKSDIRVTGNPIVRWVLVLLGFVFLAVGAIGVFVPLLPTTPFVLVAGACFLRGSRKLNVWLLRTRFFGRIIREWRAHQTIPRRAKRIALVLIVLSFGSSAAFFDPIPFVRVLVAVLGVIAFVLVSRIPTRASPLEGDQAGSG